MKCSVKVFSFSVSPLPIHSIIDRVALAAILFPTKGVKRVIVDGIGGTRVGKINRGTLLGEVTANGVLRFL